MKYIDIHGHINFAEYDTDREEVFKRASDADVGMIIVGTDVESSKSAVELAQNHDNVWATVGIHPVEVGRSNPENVPFEISPLLLELARNPKVVAIGECGLDYFHSKPDDIVHQRQLFLKHIELANKVQKPLMLHIRNGKDGGNAYQEAVNILKEHVRVRANFHFFAGTIDDAKSILEINGTMSFTGVLTFTHDYDEVVKYIPLTNIMSETDCPFVAPVPYRGKRNEPAYVVEVVKAISLIQGKSMGIISEQLVENAQNFFGLK